MKSVCLVSLPSPFLIDEKVFPPLGLMYLVTALKYQGIDAIIHDGSIEAIPQGYAQYAISATTPQFPLAIKALGKIREFGGKFTKVIIGGPHATVDPESCKKAGFDSVVIGFGEIALKLALEYGCDLISTPCKVYCPPDRDSVDIKSYKYYIDGELATSVMTTRGCPYSCAFCCKSTGKPIIHSADVVIKELEELRIKFGYKAFMFFDDIFIADKTRLQIILNHITPWGIKWRGFVRADIIVKGGYEILNKMKDSGCVEVGMGIESGSDYILKTINKGENIATIEKAITMLKHAGIRVKGFFIVGLPSESHSTIRETFYFLDRNKLSDVDFSIFTPYKGSYIYDHNNEFDIYWDDLELEDMWYKGKVGEYKSLVSTSYLSNISIAKYRDQLEVTYK